MLFSLLKHYLDTETALKVSQSVYCFTTSISHGVFLNHVSCALDILIKVDVQVHNNIALNLLP